MANSTVAELEVISTLVTETAVLGALSAAGAGCLLFFALRQYRWSSSRDRRRRLQYLAIVGLADLLAGVGAALDAGLPAQQLIDGTPNAALCITQAYLIHVGHLTSVLFQALVVHELYIRWVRRAERWKLSNLVVKFNWAVTAGLCGFVCVTLVPLAATDMMGPAGAWCWIKNEPTPFILLYRLGCFYGWVLVAAGVIGFLQVRSFRHPIPRGNVEMWLSRIFVPVMFYVIWMCAIMARVWEAADKEHSVPAGLYVFWSMVHAEGAWNAAVYIVCLRLYVSMPDADAAQEPLTAEPSFRDVPVSP